MNATWIIQIFLEQAKYQLYFEFIASITLMNTLEISWKKYFASICSLEWKENQNLMFYELFKSFAFTKYPVNEVNTALNIGLKYFDKI